MTVNSGLGLSEIFKLKIISWALKSSIFFNDFNVWEKHTWAPSFTFASSSSTSW